MHAQLLTSLATERRRDLATAGERRARSARVRKARAQQARVQPAGLLAARARRAPAATRPRLRVSWTKTTLAAVSGARRGSSVVIVISATRTS
jgi:hypothetical protein